MTRKPRNGWRISTAAALLLLVLLPLAGHADDQDQRRVLIGLNIFPAVLAADSAIEQKADTDGKLELLLVYHTDRADAQRLATRLNGFAPIRGMAVDARIASYDRLADYNQHPPAGIFLTESSPEELSAAISFGERHHIIVFSPFEGDVEQGAAAGLYVSDQILPYVNMKSLKQAGIQLRPFFLEVARHYE